MKNSFKSILAIALCFIMLMGTVAFVNIKASAETYAKGDYIYYGTYPQRDVTDSLGSELDKQPGSWVSYKYYTGTGSTVNGTMTASDYMRYKDVTYNGEKYRAVTFDNYRPYCTGYLPTLDRTYQDNNSYNTNTVYWFKYEPIKWRVLDPESGLVMCASIIDTQAYNNYVCLNNTGSGPAYALFSDEAQTHYANDYEYSNIRQWLNEDFYNLAFSDEQKSNIDVSTLNNDGYFKLTNTVGRDNVNSAPTDDKVFLLSYDEVLKSDYGFSTSAETEDSARYLKGSDYAKVQGLEVYGSSGTPYDGCSYWRLRTPGREYQYACNVRSNGTVDFNCIVNFTHYGIVPAIRIGNLNSEDVTEVTPDNSVNYISIKVPSGKTIGWKYKAKMTATADLPEGYHIVWYEGSTEKSNNATLTTENLTSSHTYTAKIADKNGKIVSLADQEKSVTVNVKTGFFDKLVSFFQRLFGSDVTTL